MPPISRRSLIGRAGGLAAASGWAGPPADPARRLKLIVVGGHPGDPEYGCGGSIARWTDAGHEVVVLYLNEGEPAGPRRIPAGTRVAEARLACEILKARPVFAGQVDGASVVDPSHSEAFLKILEPEKPDALFTHWPIDDHADHRAAAMLVLHAWLKLGRKPSLFFYEVSNGEDTQQFSPTHYLDITDAEPRKRRACFAHASQAPERFYALQDQVAKFRGIESGTRLAEGFLRHVRSRGPLPPFLA